MTTAKATKPKKRSFSSFSYKEACQQVGITRLETWEVVFEPVAPSDFFRQHLERLKCFDLGSSEESKKLMIDAVFVEALQAFPQFKMWKGAALASDRLHGEVDYVDYLVAENKAYLDAPFLCVIEAKKDDFEQGLAQCLVEMQACQWTNQQIGRSIAILGIVTNGETWKFYQLTMETKIYESMPHAIGDIEVVLGMLHAVFRECEANLSRPLKTRI